MNAQRLADTSALSLSGLCAAHCLVLPVLAALSPIMTAWAEAEWVHGLFVAIVIPTTSFALWRAWRDAMPPTGLLLLAGAGICCLTAGAVEWPNAAWETPITFLGSLCLASAHLWNWRRHARGCRTTFT